MDLLGRLRSLPPWLLDGCLAATLAAAITTAIALATEVDSKAPDAVAYTLGISIAALALFRRRWPLAVLLASFALLMAYYLLDYPGIQAAVPLSVAIATAMGAGHRAWVFAIVGWFVVAPVVFRLVYDPVRPLRVLGDVLTDALLFGAVLALGEVMRSRRELRHEHALLEAERERSERLLRNVLPDPIAARLKETTDRIAEAYPEATVLFADIVGFTELSEGMDPTDVVEILDTLFTRFDVLARERGLEKIKTIGDAYMVAAGVPVPRMDHAEAVADMALSMLEEVSLTETTDARTVGIRIGIDSGPVVAGVIGKEKFAFDLWGDTVNTASRMESSGVTGRIQVTRRTYERLAGAFRFERRGPIAVKGKGEMETYFLLRRLDRSPDQTRTRDRGPRERQPEA